MSRTVKSEDNNSNKEFERLYSGIKRVENEAKKQKSLIRDDTIELNKMDDNKLYASVIGGKLKLSIKVEGREVAVYQEP